MNWLGPAVALLAIAAPSNAAAFEISKTSTGADVRVESFPIRYDVVDTEPYVVARASRRAFDTWSRVSGGVVMPFYAGLTNAAEPMDGVSTIVVLEPWDPGFGEVERTVAHTEVFFDVSTGLTMESDIFLNGERFRFSDSAPGVFDVESVVLHELGHLLGFAHTCGDPGRTYDSCFAVDGVSAERRLAILEAVMAPTLSTGTERRDPNAVDEEAVGVHYGGGGSRVPRVMRLVRECPDDALRIEGEDVDAGDTVELRYDDGRAAVAEVTWSDGRFVLAGMHAGPVDVVVRDPATDAYGALVGVAIPEDCVVVTPPPPEEGGCACSGSGPGADGWFALILLLFVGRHGRRRSSMLDASKRSS